METVPSERAAIARQRRLYRDETVWEVREVDARRVPGSRGRACLIFEAADRIRRVWLYPAGWRVLSDAELWRLADRMPLTDANVDRLGALLAEAIARAAENMARQRALMARCRSLLEENRARRHEALALIQQYRAERQKLRVAVQSHALELRAGGVAREDALLVVASAIRESVSSSDDDLTAVLELQQLANRWCARVYSVA